MIERPEVGKTYVFNDGRVRIIGGYSPDDAQYFAWQKLSSGGFTSQYFVVTDTAFGYAVKEYREPIQRWAVVNEHNTVLQVYLSEQLALNFLHFTQYNQLRDRGYSALRIIKLVEEVND
jgi:hypothetical protein